MEPRALCMLENCSMANLPPHSRALILASHIKIPSFFSLLISLYANQLIWILHWESLPLIRTLLWHLVPRCDCNSGIHCYKSRKSILAQSGVVVVWCWAFAGSSAPVSHILCPGCSALQWHCLVPGSWGCLPFGQHSEENHWEWIQENAVTEKNNAQLILWNEYSPGRVNVEWRPMVSIQAPFSCSPLSCVKLLSAMWGSFSPLPGHHHALSDSRSVPSGVGHPSTLNSAHSSLLVLLSLFSGGISGSLLFYHFFCFLFPFLLFLASWMVSWSFNASVVSCMTVLTLHTASLIRD